MQFRLNKWCLNEHLGASPRDQLEFFIVEDRLLRFQKEHPQDIKNKRGTDVERIKIWQDPDELIN